MKHEKIAAFSYYGAVIHIIEGDVTKLGMMRYSKMRGNNINRKFKLPALIMAVFLGICVIRISFNDNMCAEINEFIEMKVKKFVLLAVDENANILKYTSGEQRDFDLYEKLGQNVGLFSYVAKSEQKIALNIYDPNMKYEKNNNNGNQGTNIVLKDDTNITDNKYEDISENVSGSKGIIYSREQLSDFNFVCNNLYVVTERANLLDTDLVYDELMGIDNRLKGNSDKPQILIYHTHSHEGFVDTEGINTSNIVAVGAYLAEVLSEQYGYNVIHCTQSFDEVNGVFDRSKAYTYATPAIEQILEQYPSIEVVLDIHRDGLKEGSEKLLTEINGKSTAQVMFFNGISRNKKGEIEYLYNKYRKENLALSFKMKLKAMELFPGFSRRNYIDAYQYNLHLRGNSMLIEVGAQNNTFEEAKNAMEPLAKLLDTVFKGK